MFKRILDKLTHAKNFHRGHALFHTGYFTFVFMEGHGLYASLGGVMAVFTLLLALSGADPEG